MLTIYILDDEKILANSLKLAFEDAGFNAKSFYLAEDFLKAAALSEPDIALIDLKLPDMNGIDVLKAVKELNRDIEVIMITAHGDINTAITAIKSGAYDFINKPFELDEMLHLISKCVAEKKSKQEIEHLRNKAYKTTGIGKLIGNSPKIKELLKTIKIVAEHDSTVLITGESGSGKELVAKALHNESLRKNEKFIDINCSSMPEHLLETELFGYEKGAFTDAKHRKTGLIELADKGTLFLDEIGDMPLALQPKLLRFLENKTFRRIGGKEEIKVDVRIVAATNKNLKQLVEEGKFRSDFYYRLNIIPIEVPPLRHRIQDIPYLCEYFLDTYSKKFGKSLKFDKEVIDIFIHYKWPGNVRELKNIIERLALLATDECITKDMLPSEMIESKQVEVGSLDFKLLNYEKQLIEKALEESGGIKQKAAEILGISRHSLKRRIAKINEILGS